MPKAGSPAIDAGDPADGAGNDVGAVGSGDPHAADKFGRVLTFDARRLRNPVVSPS
jgi:hypothetical protein